MSTGFGSQYSYDSCEDSVNENRKTAVCVLDFLKFCPPREEFQG